MNHQKITVLVVEDEPLLAKSIITKLRQNNFDTITFRTGEEAVDHLKKERVGFIWLDYYLAGPMNGVDFMRIMQADEAFRRIPVIIVSNTASDDKVKKMLELGALKYFTKAEHLLEEIIEFINSHLQKNGQ